MFLVLKVFHSERRVDAIFPLFMQIIIAVPLTVADFQLVPDSIATHKVYSFDVAVLDQQRTRLDYFSLRIDKMQIISLS